MHELAARGLSDGSASLVLVTKRGRWRAKARTAAIAADGRATFRVRSPARARDLPLAGR